MSFKTLFDKATKASSLANKSAADIGNEVESVAYHEQDIIEESRFIPNVNFEDPSTFARYGLATDYYVQSLERIVDAYPYDGSLKERLEWENDSTYIDLYLYNNLYPRTNGYVIISAEDASTTSTSTDGYGVPTVAEYIYLEGGPHPNATGMSPMGLQFTGSNYYNVANNRESNLQLNFLSDGVTLEFWLKKEEFDEPGLKEVVFDVWNGAASSSIDYTRFAVELSGTVDGLNPITVTALSGTAGLLSASVTSPTFTTESLADGAWHHYALSLRSFNGGMVRTKFYVDGDLNQTTDHTGKLNLLDGDPTSLRARLGALITPPPGSETLATPAAAGSGKLSASVDEFRFWKTQRSSKDIGRYWFSQVGGGTNSDPAPFSDTQAKVNTDLGIYFKFNEGITGITATDSTVLDYSGRVSNGAWTGYTSNSRNTGSAIVLSNSAIKEFKDPIIYPEHPDVVTLKQNLVLTGSEYDGMNNASIYASLPAWITEEDEAAQRNVKYLTQIMASYFDTLHMQMGSMNALKDVEYISGSNKPYPFSNKLLNSYGFVAPNIFLDADILEKLADRSEDKIYEKSLNDTKNIIYQNIYNNLTYIYKSKGTEKSFRNLIRCFGIDDELIKLNMYAKNTDYEFRENRRDILTSDRMVDFNSANSQGAVVFSSYDTLNLENTSGFISGSTGSLDGYPSTLEADILFPSKAGISTLAYADTNTISASLFGVHGAYLDQAVYLWDPRDDVNFQVFAVRDELNSPNVTFVLTGSTGGHVPYLTSSQYADVYQDTRWNLSVRIKPERYPLAFYADEAANDSYTVVFSGVEVRSAEVVNSFSVSSSVADVFAEFPGFISGSKRVFVGAHRQDFTGVVLQTSDVKVDACRYWVDYVDDRALISHALDADNHGARRPSLYAFPWNTTASYGDPTKFDTLALNWEFSQNTGSNASGQFVVADESSGSLALAQSTYGEFGTVMNIQHTGKGYGFASLASSSIKKEYLVSSRLNDLEVIAPADMVNVLTTDEQQVFKIDSRPINYFYSFEKSMSKVVSEDMINLFGTMQDFNNLVGAPVNRYRQEYKSLNFMRQKFFEKVGNDEIDFDKFYEFYKWFDSSLSYMLGQLVPASADFAENVRTVVESTTLERNKYRNIFQFVDALDNVFSASLQSNVDYGDAISSPDDDPQGTGLYPTHAPSRRQVGSSNRASINKWKYLHKPADDLETTNYLWWKNEAARNNQLFLAGDEEGITSGSRGGILSSIKTQIKYQNARPYRFSMGGTVPLGGVGTKPNKLVNFAFAATAPYGPLVTHTNIPRNIMISFDTDVEQLLDTTDEFYPAYKQRIGFGINPRINFDAHITDKRDGNTLAPFSLYSSSINSTYDNDIADEYKPGVTITNLHHDFVANQDIPAQGPFTEKFVGGRYFRHTELNAGSDTRWSRPEGYRIELGLLTSSWYPDLSGALGIVPPNYPFIDTFPGEADLGFLPDLQTAQRFRDETAKRPVNIKNILMTTASVGTRLSGTIVHNSIGNYQKNYQVVQTAGRTANDPFFNDQSFDFALYPETLATRGRFPLYLRDPYEPSSLQFDGSDDYLSTAAAGASVWEAKIGGAAGSAQAYSVSFWVRPTSLYQNQEVIWAVGDPSLNIGREIKWYGNGVGKISCVTSGLTWTYMTADQIPLGSWTHVVFTYPGGDGTSDAGKIYINGSLASSYSNTGGSVGAITTNGVTIGARTGPSKASEQYLCDLAVYNAELSADDATELYNSGTRVNIATTSPWGDILAWWKLGDHPGDSVTGTFFNEVHTIYDATPAGFTADDGFGIKKVSPSIAADLYPTDEERKELATSAAELETTANPGGALNYTLPSRTGANSNQTVIVNRFAGCGYEVMSLGYMGPAHEEMSVYNALPYRNLAVIDYGLSGSASADPVALKTITVVDQIDKNRGLDQRATLHCGQFGFDAAYGSVETINQFPSWHKTNRNPKTIIANSASQTGYSSRYVYDNLFVQHAIPRSEQQYAWVTASLKQDTIIYGLDSVACLGSSSLDELIISGSAHGPGAGSALLQDTPFVASCIHITDPVSCSAHTLGYPVSSDNSGFYVNKALDPGSSPWTEPPGDYQYFNELMLNRNGPYQYPMWKQTRTGETPIARCLRESNTIGTLLTPPLIAQKVKGRTLQYVRAVVPNQFVDYIEQPVSSRHYPTVIKLEDNTEDSRVENDITLNVTYGNLLDYFSNNGLNNRLSTPAPDLYNNSLNAVLEYVTSSQMSTIIKYSERLYPAETNAYKNVVRRRTEFTIDDIWSPSRFARTELGGGATGNTQNSQNITVNSASVWPLDGHLDFSTTGSVVPTDGAGELLNSYSRYGDGSAAKTKPAATYAARLPQGPSAVDGNPLLVGDAKWEAAEQAGKQPYEKYQSYSEKMALIGKDHSIVPEFRISPLIEDYVETNEGNFLADLNNTLQLTGASVQDSSESDFFKVYTNSDFLKYFPVIDEEVNDKRSGQLKIKRDKVSLKCSALLKFLPYKGFYPAERTVELATLFSQSYGSEATINTGTGGSVTREQAWRAMLEPFYAPGIMFNTIKSGIAVSTRVLTNTGSVAKEVMNSASLAYAGTDTELFEGVVKFSKVLYPATRPEYASLRNGYYYQELPFEALYQPMSYMTPKYLTGSGAVFDTGVSDPGATEATDKFDSGLSGPPYVILNDGKKLYQMAIDNFLCETTNFFLDGPTFFESKREDQFSPVTKDTVYQMTLKMYRTVDENGIVSTGSFNLYGRESAFGIPILGKARQLACFEAITPPYYSGSATATFTYTAQYTGVPTVDEILSNTTIHYDRRISENIDGYWPASGAIMQLDSCFNLTDYYSEVPARTNAQSRRWLIQSKFETPVLNFANVPYTRTVDGNTPSGLTPASEINIQGMWHQYGSIPTGSQEGIFAMIEPAAGNKTADFPPSLAEIVGMQQGVPMRIGETKKDNILEEALVVVPFRVTKNRRKFFNFNRASKKSETYKKLTTLMDKYIFPPKFDFTRHKAVKAVQMYAFEFSATVTQQDIADMWQNLPPDIAETFEHKEVVIEEEQLIKSLIEKAGDIQWMVFKVKKRSKKNFEKYRRSLVTNDTSAFPDAIGQYSYNWPYDYFSLVELVKIDEEIRYVSTDLTDEPTSKTQIVGDVSVTVANPTDAPVLVNLLDDGDVER